jgi:dimeric dUTPase (all-alpha-NTP-PPase superfamily)
MTTLLESQARLMLTLQSRMNAKVDPLWVEKRFPYLRAVVIEAAEAIEHHGWKWWKRQDCDLPQLQMEIIDIWHFLLSEILLQHEDDQALAGAALLQATSAAKHIASLEFDSKTYHFKDLSLVSKLELLIGLSTARRVDIALFKTVMEDCGLNWESLFKQYVSKNVLNFFRQDHGYKEGTYHKLWQGREDNEHLVELMDSLDTANPDYPELLYSGLLQRYPS